MGHLMLVKSLVSPRPIMKMARLRARLHVLMIKSLAYSRGIMKMVILKEKQEFLNLIIEAAKTGDKSELAKWWRKLFPGYKWWLVGPDFPFVLPDDGRDEP